MKTPLLLLLSMCISFTLKAQLSSLYCAGGRYANDISAGIATTYGIVYGYNTITDYSTNNTYNQTLMLDFYEPAADVAVQRPLIILAFGGGFISGQRSDLEPICIALARKGYAVAAIDYRLIYPSATNYFMVASSSALLIDEVVKASADMKAAIRFFKWDAATNKGFRIDTTKIIVGGASAGAIAALQTAYADGIAEAPATISAYNNNGGFEGNTDLPAPNSLRTTYNSRGIAGVINIAGGMIDTSLVDANNPPVYSVQGDADEVVPFNYGQPTFEGFAVPISLYGSNLIRTRANNIGLKNELYAIPGGNHASPGMEPHISKLITDASAFVRSIVCPLALPITLTSFKIQSSNCVALLHWQTASETRNSHSEIETSADGTNFTKIGTVNSKNSVNGADYTYKVLGYTQPAWFRLKMVDKDGSFTYSPVQKFNPECMGLIQVYPNPAHSKATVNGLKPAMQVNVISPEGKLLWSQKAVTNTLQIPLSTFANGLLLVQIKDVDGKTLTSTRLIKD